MLSFYKKKKYPQKAHCVEKMERTSSDDELVLILGACHSQEKAAAGRIFWSDPAVEAFIHISGFQWGSRFGTTHEKEEMISKT